MSLEGYLMVPTQRHRPRERTSHVVKAKTHVKCCFTMGVKGLNYAALIISGKQVGSI
jgi:hypothetical protein